MKEPLKFTVKPAPGRRVRDPLTYKVLADEGEVKPQNSYWLRRLADGDVLEVVASEPKHRKTAAKEA